MYIDPGFPMCYTLKCLIVHLYVSASHKQPTFVHQKTNEASFCRARTTPFQVVRSISTTIQITVLVMGYFKVTTGENIFHVEFSECVFFSSLYNMTVIETEKKVIPAVPHSVHREKLITWRQAFLGRQRGLGVFHCAHS